MNRGADVIVVGSGIIGASCAHYLAKAGFKVHVIEAQASICAGTSKACDGFVSVWDKLDEASFELAHMSAQMWAELSEELTVKFDYRRCGHLLITGTEVGVNQLGDICKRTRLAGEPAELLDETKLRSLIPQLSHSVTNGLLLPNEAQVDPRKATVALLNEAKMSGAKISVSMPVIGFLMSGGRIRGVKTADGEIGCELVVVATGVWTSELIERGVGIKLPIVPRKGHVLVLERSSFTIPHLLAEVGYIGSLVSADGLQVAFVLEQTVDGTILVGSSRELGKGDSTVELNVVTAIAQRAISVMPPLRNLLLIRTYAGLRPWTPDMMPIIGKIDGLDGMLIAAGHEGGGICMAPATGQLITKIVLGEELPSFAKAFSPTRFLKGQRS
ncbi:MAG: FAD-dependent oxidoreductase [Armatimonadota bacterium]|nr:FAD-binding oxidoreductase [Armatimonadota bacterium]MCX7776671.1 FAD-binding oxidoreductase [Armatimonadota bacterium]MDW8025714.1 FAD-dependent oxidoreductase [Armatimonadota bacterium]